MSLERILKVIKNPSKIKYNIYKRFFIKQIDDRRFLEALYQAAFGRKLDLTSPKTYNEKLQWLKLYNRDPLYTRLVDKYDVKAYVSGIIGEEYIIPSYGIYENFDEIDFAVLPEKFVLKCTHDSGSVVFCTKKQALDITKTKEKLEKRLKNNPFWDSREWPYKNVKPRIICEKLLEKADGTEIVDYKFMCFNGEPKCIFICSNRRNGKLCVDFYDMEWNHLPFERHYPNSRTEQRKPVEFELMCTLARKLSKGMPHVRVDFYEVDGKVYFGELTFFPGSGVEEFTPEKYDYIIGEWLVLPEEKRE